MSALKTNPGLDGVIAAETRISGVDGEAGELIVAGYALEEIAANAAFEEMAYLLWNGALPPRAELASFACRLAACRDLPSMALRALKAAAAERMPVMDALLMAAGTLRLGAQSNGTDNLLALGEGIAARSSRSRPCSARPRATT